MGRYFWLALAGVAAAAAAVEGPRQIQWKDLVPTLAADATMPRLTKQQALQLHDIATVRDRRERGEKVSAIDAEDEQGNLRKLREAGIDAEAILARRKEISDHRKLKTQVVNGELDGQVVRMPGYLLPLEFSGKEVTEFLLVPYVGACIHSPPPPPNQIVHVRPDKPVANLQVFAPIWVTGKMSTTAAKKSLSLVDGAADIDVGYAMQASSVEPYKE
ncbi:MAG TPA: DUF3299 domain-containing protein [Burkholderiales bacterium]|jgi:hypothetical protein|nr:DUF3299 domain-containing protein [Burkholderiales bacterium]